MYTTEQLESMNKLKLRSACRDAKVAGYSKMTVAQMRGALAQPYTAPEGANSPATEQAKKVNAAVQKAVATPAKAKSEAATPRNVDKSREERNGVKRPKAGGKCAAVWDALDKMLANGTGDTPTLANIREWAAENEQNANNAQIEFYQWKRWKGL